MNNADVDSAKMLAALALERRRPAASISETIQHKLQLVMDLVGVRSAFLAALGPYEMNVLAVEDQDGCAIPIGVVPLEESFCQYVKASEAPVVIPDAEQDVRVAHVATRTDFSIGAYLGVPIRLRDQQVYGTLCVLDPAPFEFEAHHVALVEIVAGDIAALLDYHRKVLHSTQALTDADHDLLVAFDALDAHKQALQTLVHEARTPLMGITFSLDALLLGHFGSLPVEQREILDMAFRAGKHLQRLITDLSDAIAAETATLSLLSEPFDAVVLVQRLLMLCTPEAQSVGIEIVLDCAHDEVPMIGDETRVSQILLNLLTNAMRYSNQNRVIVQIQLQDNDMVAIAVIDNGPGISPEDEQRIWQLYERASDDQHGMGIGLSIVATLTKAMGGTVKLQSRLNHGSTFVVYLPQQILSPQVI